MRAKTVFTDPKRVLSDKLEQNDAVIFLSENSAKNIQL